MSDGKIHPYLASALEQCREQILNVQVEEALRFEVADERIEERVYDEEQRLRKQRIVDRRVVRGEVLRRYAAFVSGLEASGTDLTVVRGEVRRRLDHDLREIANERSVKADLAGAVRNYGDFVPAEKWPPVLCMADSVSGAATVRDRLDKMGLTPIETALEKFGILKFACPPEMAVVNELATMPAIHALAAPATPVFRPRPMQVAAQIMDARRILGVTPEMSTRYGDDVTVAILDTGLDKSHPAFARVAPIDYRDFTGTGREDTEGHGTHVASIAAGDDPSSGGIYSGIAPRCRLVVAKVIADVGGMLEHILNGMAWAVFEKRADVLSLSLGDADTPANGHSIWSRACDEAFRQGTVVCAAVGNVEPAFPETVVVPADSHSAVAVGAIDNDGQLALFSAKGSEDTDSPLYGKPDCVAPGVGILGARSSASAFPKVDHDGLYTQLSGTSMATPAIAGCLALLKSAARTRGWEMSPSELRNLFLAACHPLKDPDGEAYRDDFEIGHGLVDMRHALDLLQRRPAAPPVVSATSATVPPTQGARSPAAATFDPDVCYACGKKYLTKVGTFSQALKCESCGAPICTVCWHIGHRRCRQHRSPGPVAPVGGKGPASNLSPSKVTTPMPLQLDVQACDEFLNGFDFKVRQDTHYFDPLHQENLSLDTKDASQSFNCSIGRARQFTLKAGLIKKRPRMILAAVALDHGGLKAGPTGHVPIPDLLRQITGQQGLDCDPTVFYAVGIYSPVGWPPEWGHGQARGNAAFYFVEKAEKAGWIVRGPDGPLRKVFDPERQEEQTRRAAAALASHPDLILSGGQVPLAVLLREFNLDRDSVEHAMRNATGRYRIIDYKGRSAVQRTTA